MRRALRRWEAYRNYDLFTDLSAQVRAGAVVGTSFVAPQELSSAEDYVFYTYTFRLENNTTLPAEMIEVQITPMSGDILQIGSDQVLTLPAHTIGDVTATILTSKDMHAIREANITYYIWGIPFTIRTTIRPTIDFSHSNAPPCRLTRRRALRYAVVYPLMPSPVVSVGSVTFRLESSTKPRIRCPCAVVVSTNAHSRPSCPKYVTCCPCWSVITAPQELSGLSVRLDVRRTSAG